MTEGKPHIIEAISLGKTYKKREGPVEALREFSLQVEGGEILGLLGPNGAGKTTAVKIIMGFISPSSGRVLLNGCPLQPAMPRPAIGYLPENFRPNPNLTVLEYVKFQCDLAGGSINGPGKSRALNLLNLVGMDRFPNRRISDLSKGMGQRVGLAQAFSGDPELLILDEPTSGLDPVGKSEVIEVLLAMKQRGKTIFFCSHILSEVERLCDRIGILVDGALRFLGPTEGFKRKWESSDLDECFKREVQWAKS
ncbi:MAG: ABC transporter ATP-binding protein [Proteobacteria bacterium]|nr:ABC transporter ATP-binding protein [Pseudomonadota bacterium]